MDRLTAERIARNQHTFRSANDRIVAAAGEIGVEPGTVPFICECDDPACTEVLAITVTDYAAVRRHPRRFLHSSSHGDHVGELVEVHDGYVVVEKTGLEGEIAEELA